MFQTLTRGAPARAFLLATALAGASLVPQSADAAIMLLTRTAVISYVDAEESDLPYDPASLRGTTFTVRVKYDTTKGSRPNPSGSPSVYLEDAPGSHPVLEVSYAFGPPDGVYAYTDFRAFHIGNENQVEGVGEHALSFGGVRGRSTFEMSLSGLFSSLPRNLDTPFEAATVDEGFAYGPAGVGRFNFSLGDGVTRNGSIRLERLDTPVAPVPEPATWALMIIGFGAAGTALRRRCADGRRRFNPAVA